MKKSKQLSKIFVMVPMFLVLAFLGLLLSACGNTEKQTEYATVTVKQYCDGVESKYGIISGEGRYKKGSIVELGFVNAADGYYFDRWNDESTTDYYSVYYFEINSDITVNAFFKKGQSAIIDGHIIKVNNGTIDVTEKSFEINTIADISDEEFSYWDMNGEVYKNTNKRIIEIWDFNSPVREDMTFTPVSASCGVVAIVGYDNNLNILTSGTIYDFSTLRSILRQNSSNVKYAIARDDYQQDYSYFSYSNYFESNLTPSSQGSMCTYDVAVPSSYTRYYTVFCKIFYDKSGNLKCTKISFEGFGNQPGVTAILELKVKIADSLTGQTTHMEHLGVKFNITME